MSDWPFRAKIRDMYRPDHDREILQAEGEVTTAILEAIDAQGPLSSLEFEDTARYESGSWYGLTRTKRVLRAMWACGLVVTHHRKNGRHYYDRPERVIPAHHYNLPPLVDEDTYHRWIVARRFQAVGLLRPNADQSIWSASGTGETRKRAIAQLVEEGALTLVYVGVKPVLTREWGEVGPDFREWSIDTSSRPLPSPHDRLRHRESMGLETLLEYR